MADDGDWPEETQAVTNSAGCLASRSVRDAHGADSTGLLVCSLDFNHAEPDHYDESEELHWREALP